MTTNVTVETLRAALKALGFAPADINRLVRITPVPR